MTTGGGTSFEASIVPVCSPPKRHSAASQDAAAAGESLMLAGEGKWRKDPLYYNPLQDKNAYSYLTAPSVLQLLKKQGMVASVSV